MKKLEHKLYEYGMPSMYIADLLKGKTVETLNGLYKLKEGSLFFKGNSSKSFKKSNEF